MAAKNQQQLNGDVNITGNLTVGGQIINQIQDKVSQIGNAPPPAALGAAYRSPALYPSSALTSTPTAPSINVIPAQKALVISWDFQGDLANFQRYEIQCSSDNSTWYSLSNNMTTGLGTLNALTQTATELYIHVLPAGTTLYYRVRRVNKVSGSDNDGAWSTSKSNTSGDSTAPSLAAATIYAQVIVVGDLFFTDKVASQTNLNPSVGDVRSVVTKGSIEIDEAVAVNPVNWARQFLGTQRAGTALVDLTVSGRVVAGSGLYSGPGSIWSTLTLTAYNGAVIGTYQDYIAVCGQPVSGTPTYALSLSSDNGDSWTADISVPTYGNIIMGPGSPVTIVIWTNGSSTIATSTDGGSTWTSGTVTGNYGIDTGFYEDINGKFVVGDASGYIWYSSDGLSWVKATTPASSSSIGGFGVVGSTIIAVGSSTIISSTDCVTWTLVTSSLPADFTSGGGNSGILFATSGTTTSAGHIWRSVDGGASWTSVLTLADDLWYSYSNNLFLLVVGDNTGSFYLSIDGGISWSVVTTVVVTNAAVGVSNTAIIAAESSTVYAISHMLQAGAGIVESGSNSNGSWVKWADGTMIEWFVGELTGSSGTITYPVPFAGDFPGLGCVVAGDGTATANFYNWGLSSVEWATSAANLYVTLTAIGKWK